MDCKAFDALDHELASHGPAAAIDWLCRHLEDIKDYGNLFYALLLKKRHELGVSPVPTEAASALPEALHEPYEDAIREAGRRVGRLFLETGDIPRAWMYFRMLGEPEPVAQALEQRVLAEGEDCQPLIDVAYHQGVHPRKGFDWILERYGICNAITTLSGSEFPDPSVREYCIRQLVRALYEQLRQRLADDLAQRTGTEPSAESIRQLLTEHEWPAIEDYYHVDVSHLSSVVQMSVALPPGEELNLARELCLYGRRLSSRFLYPGDPPFEDTYRDYGIYLDVLASENVEAGLAHFRAKVETADPETIGTYPADVLVNLLLRLKRPTEALAIARRYLAKADTGRPGSPSLAELCRLATDYETLAEVSRERNDPVHFLAGRIAATRPKDDPSPASPQA